MSISKGGQSVKPYVGSKEVQEAYVGGQLVYKSGPPIEYGFLGGENDYVIADWCKLTINAAVVKETGVYRIGLTSNYDGNGRISLTEIKGSKLLFTLKKAASTTQVIARFLPSAKEVVLTGSFNENNYTLGSVDVPTNTTTVQITVFNNVSYGVSGWIDALRFEE